MTKMNIPNRLTIIRILLVPVVVAVYLCMDPTLCVIDETSGLALRDVIAFVIFAVAVLPISLMECWQERTIGSLHLENLRIQSQIRC